MQVKTRSSRAHTLGLKSDSTPYILEEKHIILPSYLVCIDRCGKGPKLGRKSPIALPPHKYILSIPSVIKTASYIRQ